MDNFMMESNTTTHAWIGTTAEPPVVHFPPAAGYASMAVTVILFGSNFLPVKKYETGDGMFFQWITCTVVWVTGLVVNCIRGFPQFYPLCMLGGFLWSTGNCLCIPIIKTIGLGQGLCLWASVNLLSGWASGRFGWFGTTPQEPTDVNLNYIGVALCALSAVAYVFLKTTVQAVSEQRVETYDSDEHDPLLGNERGLMNDNLPIAVNSAPQVETVFFERMAPLPKRIAGTVMAVIAGFFFGLNFVPVVYVKNNYPHPMHDIDYVFAHFCGIFLTSTFYFTVYCIAMRNRPRVYPRAILPSMVSGLMWAIADIGWFVANDALSAAISFPIITSIPAIIASLWGIAFKEIRGLRNFLILSAAIFLAVSGSITTGLSKREMGHPNSTTYMTTV